jgi:ribosomal protein S18 acetylase RimI-like enzyme
MPTIDDYVTPLKLPMTIDTFSRFPALAGYKAELKGPNVELSYQPRLSMARLRVASRAAREVDGVAISPIDVRGFAEPLAKLFAMSFAHVPPLDTMAPTTRRHAADAEMKHLATGGQGALFEPACLGAVESASHKLVGAAIVTKLALRPDEWPDAEMPSPLLNLTWLFVAPGHQRRAVGTALLDHVVSALAKAGHAWLVSHIPQDNVPVVMFHWRNGFELVQRIAKP